MKIDWKAKLSSRKFWTALLAWLTSLLGAFHIADSTTTQIVVIVSGIGSLCVYMMAESAADRARAACMIPDCEVHKEGEGESET